MFGIETLSGTAQAMAIVGVVLAEAIALYVGYGALARITSPTVLNALGGD